MLGWKGESEGFPDVYSSIQRMNETLTGPWGRHRPGSGNRRLRCVKCVLDWLGAHFWSGGWGLGAACHFSEKLKGLGLEVQRHIPFSDVLGLVFVPVCLSFLPESLLSSGSLQKILSTSI